MSGSSFFRDNPTRSRVGGSTGGRCFTRGIKRSLRFIYQGADAVLDGLADVLGGLLAGKVGFGFFKNDVHDRRILRNGCADPFDNGKETLRGLFVADGNAGCPLGIL